MDENSVFPTSMMENDPKGPLEVLPSLQAGDYILALQLKAIELGASDIFLAPYSRPAFRIDGKTLFLEKEKILDPRTIENFASHSFSERDLSLVKKNLEHDFGITLQNNYRLRVNAVYQRYGLSCAMRIIPNRIFTFEELNLPEQIRKIVDVPSGLVLCVGAAGSGKSTTLATIIDHINEKYKKHIITIEDPIEFHHENKRSLVEQRSVELDTHSFANALRSSLRQAPDVLLVGELRDLESLSLAVTAAETGTLVFGTIHANTASSTITRIIDFFPGDRQNQIRIQLAQSLQCVIWQKLIPKKGGKGRVPVHEVLSRTPAIANLIRENKVYQIDSFIQTSAKEANMLSYRESLSDLVSRDKISQETADDLLHKYI